MRHPRKTLSRLAAACTATVLLTAGCGMEDDSSEAPSGGAAEGTDRLSYAYAFTPVAALSPYSDDAVTSYGVGATETLVRLDPAGTPEPVLATSWEQTDDTTWRFELRRPRAVSCWKVYLSTCR